MPEASPLILIVDDEEHVARVASVILKRAGYRTLTATSPGQAVELWTAEISLLLTDCIMPDLLGVQLARKLRDRNPALKTLFMSGNSIESIRGDVSLSEGINFIQKPFRPERLVELVGRALGHGGTE